MTTSSSRWTSLITGGCGFVGRHLTRRLLSMGHHVWLVDNLSTGQHPDQWLKDKIVSRRVDGSRIIYELDDISINGPVILTYQHGNIITALMEQMACGGSSHSAIVWPRFESVFHLASIVGGRVKIEGDPLHVGVDLAIDSLFFRWVTTHTERVGRVLYASSSAAYPIALQGVQGAVALREDMLVPGDGVLGQPDMSYGWSKLTGEYLAHLAAKHYGVKVACVRPFSGYGEDQETCYPVAAIAQRVVQQENPVTVWGTGEQGRDFVHIDDCITAMLRASARITDGSAVNIGTGRLTTFLELAQLMVRLHGRHAAVVPQLGRPVGVQSRYADCTKQRELLDFVPRIDLETGMARVLQAAVIRHVRPEADARGQPHPGAVPHAIRPLSEHP